MYLLLRSIAGTLASLVVIILSAAGAMGLAGWIGIGLTSPSVAAPVIITTLAIADSVHILVTYFADRRQGMSKDDALVDALKINFMPVFMTSVTTAMGFLAINITDSPPLRDLGNITAMGVILAWAVSVTALPALMSIFPHRVPAASKDRLASALEAYGRFAVRRRTPLLIVASIVCLGILALLPKNETNDLFAHYFDPRIEFRTDTRLRRRQHLRPVHLRVRPGCPQRRGRPRVPGQAGGLQAVVAGRPRAPCMWPRCRTSSSA